MASVSRFEFADAEVTSKEVRQAPFDVALVTFRVVMEVTRQAEKTLPRLKARKRIRKPANEARKLGREAVRRELRSFPLMIGTRLQRGQRLRAGLNWLRPKREIRHLSLDGQRPVESRSEFVPRVKDFH